MKKKNPRNSFPDNYVYKVIYVAQIEDDAHKNLLKIGDANLYTNLSIDKLYPNSSVLNQAARRRVDQYTGTAGVEYVLLHTELGIRRVTDKNGNVSLEQIRDYKVRQVLKNSGYNFVRIGNTSGIEWYPVDLCTAKQAIERAKEGAVSLGGVVQEKNVEPIIFRPEQRNAIEMTVAKFSRKKPSPVLWNAKMRFGKTLTALEVAKRLKAHKTIIFTQFPDVEDEWATEFRKIFTDGSAVFASRSKVGLQNLLNGNDHFIYFTSLQDLAGSAIAGGKFDKNDLVFDTNWDLVIIDEAHRGTTTERGREVQDRIIKTENKEKTCVLRLSGTPYNIVTDFKPENIFTWDYIQEQMAKQMWDREHFDEPNPYESLPEMAIYTYDLGALLHRDSSAILDGKAFSFREFFRTWTGDIKRDLAPIPDDANEGDFVHKDDVRSFLNLISVDNEDVLYPYSTPENREMFKHTLWMLPGVKQARALSSMLKDHPVFGKSGLYEVINIAGDGDEEISYEKASTYVKSEIAKAETVGRGTITLSCGKMTTGCTVKEWTGILMLAGSVNTSAASYMQTIFRVQSPNEKNGKMKTKGYVFDFAPDRALTMVSDVIMGKNAKGTSESERIALGAFLNYCPVISFSGTDMKKLNTDTFLQRLKKAYAACVADNGFDDNRIYNDNLFHLTDLDLKDFDEMKAKIGTSKKKKDKKIDVNAQGFDEEEHEQTGSGEPGASKHKTPEDKEREDARNRRKNAIDILRGVSIRIPLLVYGADINIDEDFTIESLFDNTIIDDKSWEEFMPKGVTREFFRKFVKFYDPDIFVAAGRKIRKETLEADSLLPLERVRKIAEIFSHFKNPDKETVLTPWRAVNIHMSDTLGGYDFFNEEDTSQLDVPIYINNGNLTMQTVSNPEAKLLEINSKTGLYPLYLTYSLFKERSERYTPQELTPDLQKRLWNETVENNIYVLCRTQMAKSITVRTLIGYQKNVPHNIRYLDNMINKLRSNTQWLSMKINKPSYWGEGKETEMKFDAIVGNPPYALTQSKTSDIPIYNNFMDSAFLAADVVSFITPGRFLTGAGKTPKGWAETILNDPHFKVIHYYPNSLDIFNNVEIKGGVLISLRDNNTEFGPIGTFSPFDEMETIVNSVKKFSKRYLAETIASPENYHFAPLLHSEHPEVLQRLSKGHHKDIVTNIFEKLPDLLTQTPPHGEYIRILGRHENRRCYRYIEKKYIVEDPLTSRFKLSLPKAYGKGEFGEPIPSSVISEPGDIHTQTFMSIGSFDSRDEAEACQKYIQSRFVRALVGLRKSTQDNKKRVWTDVPLEDFTSQNKDIDWSGTLDEIDNQLCEKYQLNAKEKDFLFKMIPNNNA